MIHVEAEYTYQLHKDVIPLMMNATVMDVVDVSPQSTIRSWTCNDVKTWPKNVELKDRFQSVN
ncbi:hypothetical protein pdam_00020148 [Pocillopora damicornis]|uniref:Uncharacterized protein n=1 Tax=Pocillopora damicornis TaxID=46731 RepID=A0A3M6T9R7_POCDA|nr:hypothetical protein pdam_00020148 [Pocillopora damicornis]